MSESKPLPFDLDALCEVFRDGEKPAARFRLGVEAEKFGLKSDGSPLQYQGKDGVEGLFERLVARGWEPVREAADGPIVALTKGGASVTLEPGAQVELSGTPADDVHELKRELHDHLLELESVCRDCDLYWLHIGFHPLAQHGDLSWVPKQRYPVMKEYLPRQGSRGLDMMLRTATVQVNLDYDGEADAMTKLVTLLRLTPFLQALTLNAPFFEGKVSRLRSERLDVWLNMDPLRSGLIRKLWETPTPRYRDYAEWALDAGMFLFKRPRGSVLNTGQSFRDFLVHGFDGERATLSDWKLHLGTLFPEVRLKTTLEVRGVDALPPALSLALPALLAGIVYDERSLAQARELVAPLDFETAVALQRAIAVEGPRAHVSGISVGAIALQLLQIAMEGLSRRATSGRVRGDESVYLEPLLALAERGLVPADEVRESYLQSGLALQDFLRGWARQVSMPE